MACQYQHSPTAVLSSQRGTYLVVAGDGGDVQGCQCSIPDLLDVSPTVQQGCQQLCIVLKAMDLTHIIPGTQLSQLKGAAPALACLAMTPLAVMERDWTRSRDSGCQERLGEWSVPGTRPLSFTVLKPGC